MSVLLRQLSVRFLKILLNLFHNNSQTIGHFPIDFATHRTNYNTIQSYKCAAKPTFKSPNSPNHVTCLIHVTFGRTTNFFRPLSLQFHGTFTFGLVSAVTGQGISVQRLVEIRRLFDVIRVKRFTAHVTYTLGQTLTKVYLQIDSCYFY